MNSPQSDNRQKNARLIANQSADATNQFNDIDRWNQGLFRKSFTHGVIENRDKLNLRLFD